MTWFMFFLGVLLGYVVRHFDIVRVHTPPDLFTAAMKKKAKAQEEKMVDEILKKVVPK